MPAKDFLDLEEKDCISLRMKYSRLGLAISAAAIFFSSFSPSSIFNFTIAQVRN